MALVVGRERQGVPTVKVLGALIRQAVQRRIEVYRNETVPVLEFYRGRGLLLDISGLDTIERVNENVLAGLGVQ